MTENSLQVVNKAVADRVHGIISAREGDLTHRISVRFAGDEPTEEHLGFWARIVEGEPGVLHNLIETGSTLEVSFRTQTASIFFDTIPLRERRKLFSHRVLLRYPDHITIIERRKDSRETVAEEIVIEARMQPEGDATQWIGRLWDISPTGASFLCGTNPPPPKLALDDPLSIALSFNHAERKLIALHRYTQPLSSSTVRLGVQFPAGGDFDPKSEWFLEMVEHLRSRRIRDTFRHTLRKTFLFHTSYEG
jgi:hypothetical protein